MAEFNVDEALPLPEDTPSPEDTTPGEPTRNEPKLLDEDTVFDAAQRFAERALDDEFSIEEQVQFLETFRRLERQSLNLNGVGNGEAR